MIKHIANHLKLISLAVLLLCLMTVAQASVATELIPIRDFFQEPLKSDFKISRGGTYIAFLQPWQNRKNLFVQHLSSDGLPLGKPQQITFFTDRSLNGYIWKGDTTILYSKDQNGDENFHIHAIDIVSKIDRDLTPYSNSRAFVFDDLEDSSDNEILIRANIRDPKVYDIYKLNIYTADKQIIAKNPGNISSWLSDHQGQVRIATMREGLNTKILSRKSNSDEFKSIIEFDYSYSCVPIIFTSDGKELYVASNLQHDTKEIIKIDPDTGAIIQHIWSHPSVDVEALAYSSNRKIITAARYSDWKMHYHFFNPEDAALYEKIKLQLGDKDIFYHSKNAKEDLIIVAMKDDKVANCYYLYNVKNNMLTLLFDSSLQLPSENMATMQPISYVSRDKVTINGYLTLPPNSNGKNLPVVINPHGGPWTRDHWGYNPEVQFLANRGYAVLQINYRGSTGYGRNFYIKSFKQWGKSMQDDITDGVQWLIANGIADPKRVAIYGASYGGFATLAGITFTPDLYACAIDYVGISNLFTFFNTRPAYWHTLMEQYKEAVGDPEKDHALFKQISPIFHVDKIKTPLLVAQGAKDPRVNINESNQIVTALRSRGIDVMYIVKDNEGHGFRNEENRMEFYAAMEKFLEQHLQNKPKKKGE